MLNLLGPDNALRRRTARGLHSVVRPSVAAATDALRKLVSRRGSAHLQCFSLLGELEMHATIPVQFLGKTAINGINRRFSLLSLHADEV